MNRERRVGRRSVVRNLIKLDTPEFNNEEIISTGPKKSLFNDDSSFVMKRTLKPLHEINNLQFSSSKSKSHEKLYENNTFELPRCSYTNVLNKHKIPMEIPSRMSFLDSSMVKNRCKPSEPVLQSKELYSTLIDSPCTKYQKVQFNNALSSASKYLLNRHLESVQNNAELFKEKIESVQNNAELFKEKAPEANLPSINENDLNELKTPDLKDLNNTPKQEKYQSDPHIQISSIPKNTPLLIEDIEEIKKK